MRSITIADITERLHQLPEEKLLVVYDFVSYMSEREMDESLLDTVSKSYDFMLASEAVLRRDWDGTEEDTAWVSL